MGYGDDDDEGGERGERREDRVLMLLWSMAILES